jgi:hypothetical protein
MLGYGWHGVARLWALLLLGAAAVFWLGSISLLWMHFAILRQERLAVPELAQLRFLPELEPNTDKRPAPDPDDAPTSIRRWPVVG